MKVFLIIDETNFYQPNFIKDLLQYQEFEFVGCALVTKVGNKSNIENYIIRNFYLLQVKELWHLFKRKIIYSFKDHFNIGVPNNFYSVQSVLKFFNIPYFKVKYDINTPKNLEKIKNYKPDVILSSNSLFFKKELLSIAKCLNRHSSLLPSYGGLWPIFQALRNNEKEVGVTVHLMNSKIDSGKIVSQLKIVVNEIDTVDSLYYKCFRNSAMVCVDALNQIRGIQNTKNVEYEESYFSFPKKEHWKDLRKLKRKFI